MSSSSRLNRRPINKVGMFSGSRILARSFGVAFLASWSLVTGRPDETDSYGKKYSASIRIEIEHRGDSEFLYKVSVEEETTATLALSEPLHSGVFVLPAIVPERNVRIRHNGSEVRFNSNELVDPPSTLSSAVRRYYTADINGNATRDEILTVDYKFETTDPWLLPVFDVPADANVEDYTAVVKYPADIKASWVVDKLLGAVSVTREESCGRRSCEAVVELSVSAPENGVTRPVPYSARLALEPANGPSAHDGRALVQYLLAEKSVAHFFSDVVVSRLADSLKGSDSWSTVDNILEFVHSLDEPNASAFSTVRFRPTRTIKQVIDSQSANPRERTLLFYILARLNDLDVTLLAVEGKYPGSRTNGLLLPYLDAIACKMSVDGQESWIAPEASTYVPDAQLRRLFGRRALDLLDDAPTWNAISLPARPLLDIEIDASLATLDRSDVVFQFSNATAAVAEILHETYGDQESVQFFSSVLSAQLYRLPVDFVDVRYKTSTAASYQAIADLSSFVIKSKRKVYVPVQPFVYYLHTADSLDAASPTMLAGAYDLSVHLSLDAEGLSFDSDSTIVTVPGIVHFESRGSYDGTKASFQFRIRQEKTYLDVDESEAYRAFVRQLASAATDLYGLYW